MICHSPFFFSLCDGRVELAAARARRLVERLRLDRPDAPDAHGVLHRPRRSSGRTPRRSPRCSPPSGFSGFGADQARGSGRAAPRASGRPSARPRCRTRRAPMATSRASAQTPRRFSMARPYPRPGVTLGDPAGPAQVSAAAKCSLLNASDSSRSASRASRVAGLAGVDLHHDVALEAAARRAARGTARTAGCRGPGTRCSSLADPLPSVMCTCRSRSPRRSAIATGSECAVAAWERSMVVLA